MPLHLYLASGFLKSRLFSPVGRRGLTAPTLEEKAHGQGMEECEHRTSNIEHRSGKKLKKSHVQWQLNRRTFWKKAPAIALYFVSIRGLKSLRKNRRCEAASPYHVKKKSPPLLSVIRYPRSAILRDSCPFASIRGLKSLQKKTAPFCNDAV